MTKVSHYSISIFSTSNCEDANVFLNCYSLEKVTIPSSLLFINNSVFNDLRSLKCKSFLLLSTLEAKVFEKCTSLIKVTLDENTSFEKIKYNAFFNCISLKEYL